MCRFPFIPLELNAKRAHNADAALPLLLLQCGEEQTRALFSARERLVFKFHVGLDENSEIIFYIFFLSL